MEATSGWRAPLDQLVIKAPNQDRNHRSRIAGQEDEGAVTSERFDEPARGGRIELASAR